MKISVRYDFKNEGIFFQTHLFLILPKIIHSIIRATFGHSVVPQ